jgi:hypothetical protein
MEELTISISTFIVCVLAETDYTNRSPCERSECDEEVENREFSQEALNQLT